MNKKYTVLFHRDFKSFTGGHLKVWEYFQHVNSSENFNAEIFFTPQSSWFNNPWLEIKDHCLQEWKPDDADVLFLAGMDWLALSKQQRLLPPVPVINFIQHVRHADKNCPLYEFLKYPAIRICVSQEVANAINETRIVNGPVIVNPNGLDHSLLPEFFPAIQKDIPLLLIGYKNPDLAYELSEEMRDKGVNCQVITKHLLRDEYLAFVNRSAITVFLPDYTEGFYLPALEAMCLKTLVICPDCVGNRSFCIDNVTCLRPDYISQNIIKAVKTVLLMTEHEKQSMIERAYLYAQSATLERERKIFFNLLSDLIRAGCPSVKNASHISLMFRRILNLITGFFKSYNIEKND